MMVRVFLVDDHPLVWQGLVAVLGDQEDMEAVGYASNGRDAERLFASLKPDLALVDLRLPGEYGIDIAKRLKPLSPACKFVILSTFANLDDVQNALEMGVDGYILKEALPEELLSGLRLVSRGRPYFDPVVMTLVAQTKRGHDPFAELTERELDVLAALASGHSNREIAKMLFVAENTVKKHISGILSKLMLKDRTQAALFAVAHGLGDIPKELAVSR